MAQENTTYNDEEELDALDDLSEEEKEILRDEAQKELDALEKERDEMLENLAKSVEKKFFDRAVRRSTKESEWRASMELYLGNLAVTDFIRSGKPFTDSRRSSRPYHNIVRNKCEIAVAQSVAMQFAGGEKNWSMGPALDSKDPIQIAKARGMDKEVEVQLEHCAYGRKSRRAIEDRVILGTGVLKGPVNTGKQYNTYEQSHEVPDLWVPKISTSNYPSIEHVNPWFFYPDDTVNEFDKAEDCIEIHPKSKLELKKMAKHPGFIEEAIAKVIKQNPTDYLASTFSSYKDITASNPYLFEDKYLVMEYHGPITKESLEAMFIEPAYDAVDDEYYGEVWVCQGEVIRIELENIEACFELPYAVSVWTKDPSFWAGFGSPQLMKDAQRVARETWHMILDNASLSSGPQLAMHKNFIEPADNNWEIEPRKIWYLTDNSVDVNKALQFFDVPNVVNTLMPVLELARKFAEEESSTPMIAGGIEGSQMTESATGALMLKQASTTVMDFLSEDWDDYVTEKIIRRMWAWNMQYGTNQEIKGNYRIDVRTSTEYKNKQQYLRDVERLSVECKQDPELALMVKRDGLLRARLSMMHLPTQDIVRSEEEIEQLKQQAAQNKQPDPELLKIQVMQQELELKDKQLTFEMQQQQQREAWDHEERMTANYARTVESQAMVIRSQNEKETQYLQLAARMEEGDKKNAVLMQIAVMNDQTTKFTKAMEENRKSREALLTQKELILKAQTGSGI